MTALKRSAAMLFVVALLLVPAASASAASTPSIPNLSQISSLLGSKGGSSSQALSGLTSKLSSLSISKSQITSALSGFLKYLPPSLQSQVNGLLAKLPNTISLSSLTSLLPKGVAIPGLG